MNSALAHLTLYCPLQGATFDSASVGLIGGRVSASVPYEDEWRAIQQTDVMLARSQAASRQQQSAPPPLCLTVFEPRGVDESIDTAIARSGAGMVQEVRDAVLALRLFKSGWFLDPELAETCFAVAAEGWALRRRPGPYRQAFLGGVEGMPFVPYRLEIADLTVERNKPGSLTAIWDQLVTFRVQPNNASVEIALENFNRSYGFQLPAIHRLANLFMALDAMLGGMSARRLGNVMLRRNWFGKRVQAALSVFEPDAIASAEEAAWLDGHDGGRGLRNAIAHGDHDALGDAATAAQERLQHIVRLLLRQYMRFAIRWAKDWPNIAARFKLRTPCPLAAAYSKVLEARVGQSDAAIDLLC